eukprot:364277-Chlamydomonas_euryale.AAC.9
MGGCLCTPAAAAPDCGSGASADGAACSARVSPDGPFALELQANSKQHAASAKQRKHGGDGGGGGGGGGDGASLRDSPDVRGSGRGSGIAAAPPECNSAFYVLRRTEEVEDKYFVLEELGSGQCMDAADAVRRRWELETPASPSSAGVLVALTPLAALAKPAAVNLSGFHMRATGAVWGAGSRGGVVALIPVALVVCVRVVVCPCMQACTAPTRKGRRVEGRPAGGHTWRSGHAAHQSAACSQLASSRALGLGSWQLRGGFPAGWGRFQWLATISTLEHEKVRLAGHH